MTKLLIDTDIGDDIDDALALAAVIQMPSVQLIGVTTVYKNTDMRARLARKLLKLGGVPDVPVYAGCGDGVSVRNDRQERFCQYSPDLDTNVSLAPDNAEAIDPDEAAVRFILDSVERYGKELTIVAIGPLTNIAKAILSDLERMRRIGRIVLMGGAFYEHFREWNILCDPEAAEVVFQSGIALECLGTDVTRRCQLSEEQYQWILNHRGDGMHGFLGELVRLWSRSYEGAPIMHDPLAVWHAVHGQFVELEPALVAVETGGKHCRGMTLNLDECYKYLGKPPAGVRVSVAKSVDSSNFLQQFMTALFNYKENEEGDGK